MAYAEAVTFSDLRTSPEHFTRLRAHFDDDTIIELTALETGVGYCGTVEFFPEEGKYHMDGHRKCELRLAPEQTRATDGRCAQTCRRR